MILVGTNHIDFKGTKRLEKVLEKFKPTKLSLEMPKNVSIQEAKEFISNQRESFFKAIYKAKIGENYKKIHRLVLEAKYFEGDVSIQYYEKTDTQLFFVDKEKKLKLINIDSFKNRLEQFYEQLSDEDKHLSFEELKNKQSLVIDASYFNSKSLDEVKNHQSKFKKYVVSFSNPSKKTPTHVKRELSMTRNILEVMPDLHIGGLMHIVDYDKEYFGFSKLYSRIGLEDKKRFFLNEADNF